MTRIRTLDFLPSIFQTPTNSQFLGATLDQLVNPPVTKTIQGYVGSKLGYGIDAKDYYVTEPTKTRRDYQLEPGVVFLKENEETAKDFISYPGIIDSLKLQNGITDNNNDLFNSQIYSFDPFCNLDNIINYNQYYWLPEGAPAVTVSASTVFTTNDYKVEYTSSGYNITTVGAGAGSINPTLTLLRGGTYNFIVDQDTQFWIQGEPGITGYSPIQPNLYTRDIYGVTNNGASKNVVSFFVPQKDAQNEFNKPGNNLVDLVCNKKFQDVNGKLLSQLKNIDGVTELNNRTVLFFNGQNNEIADLGAWDMQQYDQAQTLLSISFDDNQYISTTSQNIYTVIYLTNYEDPNDPFVMFVPTGQIITNEKYTANYGTEYVGLSFYQNVNGFIEQLPYISAPLDTLYYQDGTNPNNFGVIKLIENNETNTIDVTNDILGQPTYTSSNGVKFTNGLKVRFDGDIVPASYLRGDYYVEGVGVSIQLIPTDTLVTPEPFTTNANSPYDILPFDVGPYDAGLNIPTVPDYITIARNSINKNAWARSNRWFHIQVIEDTATYLNNPAILTTYATPENKAKRPIIQFYPNLKLFNSGTIGKNNVDFIDFRTTDAFDFIEGQQNYYPDVQTYTEYTGNINANIVTNVRDIIKDQWYYIETLGTVPNQTDVQTWLSLGAEQDEDGTFEIGIDYIITDLGTTDWNAIAGTTGYVYTVGSTFTADIAGPGTGDGKALKRLFKSINAGVFSSNTLVNGLSYTIQTLGTTQWNDLGYVGTPVVGGTFTASIPSFAFGDVINSVGTGTVYQGQGTVKNKSITTVTIDADKVNGTLSVGQWINDMILGESSRLPVGTRILDINGSTTLTITVYYPIPQDIIPHTYNPLVQNSGASFAANDTDNNDLSLFAGARIVFADEANESLKNKIYVVNFNNTGAEAYPVITLTEAEDGQILEGDQFPVQKGYEYEGKSFYFDGIDYIQAQQKNNVNQAPLFDIFDENNISLGNQEIYPSSTFEGCKLFNYRIGAGINDSVLGFPISYSSINNVGDIRFDVSLYTDTFNYVTATGAKTANVNTGYIFNFSSRIDFERLIGWQTTVAESQQYQVFQFEYIANDIPRTLLTGETIDYTVTCDIPQLSQSTTVWPSIQVFNNNNILTENVDFTVTNTDTSTVVTIKLSEDIDTPIEILLLSDKVSENAYYTIPVNLANNPFNTNPESVDIGDIRGQYTSIFYNNPNTTGTMFGPNNYRDLGNMVPWGNRIIQNSASLVLPGAFLRNPATNLFDSLLFNSREYVKFKTLLVDTINRIAYNQKYDPANLLDIALDEITSVKNQEQPFFWSDMIPNKAAYITNTYTFANDQDTSIFPLSKIYDFSSANYDGVLIYLQRKIQGVVVTKQLLTNIDYTISTDSPSVTVTQDLISGDKIIIKEYNKTYGSFVPNTPTKLGLYPAYIPKAFLDTSYVTPTWFIQGHDGSLNKMYGEYNEILGVPVDFRDQILLEYETRVYNNLKLSRALPIVPQLTIPGYFRETPLTYTQYTYVYSNNFLDWIGQNRLDYKTQLYLPNDPWTYNYRGATFKLDNSLILQGNWRGIYEYVYDTATPNTTPWEMIGYANKPDWWETRYGPAPYTSNNLILWTDMENGYDYGKDLNVDLFKRPGLLQILPVDSAGELVQPLNSVVANFNSLTFRRSWIVGDDAPVEYSYRKSSTYPFDLMRLQALIKPALFYNLGSDLDNYKYSPEFNQFLVNDRTHLVPSDIQIYGNGTPKTSYINWIVDYQKQLGVDATDQIKTLLTNLDVRLVYRLAGFSDKSLLKFFVEKGSPTTPNPSLLIPDESYQVLLYNNQPSIRITYSGVVVQKVLDGYAVYGNNQQSAYFRILRPKTNGNKIQITVQDATVYLAEEYYDETLVVPYGTIFYSEQEVSQFLISYGKYLEEQGMQFDSQLDGIVINWPRMVQEYLYWAQSGWSANSVVTLNPAADTLAIDKESMVVQPLTFTGSNFILNNNLYPIQLKDLNIFRDGTEFIVKPLNEGDALAYGQFDLSNIEHGIVFNNITLFNDVIYNLSSGLKQNRIYVRGTKSAEWNGTMFASGFIYNQDNITNWQAGVKYTKGAIVKYKNKFFTAITTVQPNKTFKELEWKETDYDEIQKGLLPNSSTRSYESSLYYNVDKANLESDADQLSFSLIGFRPRDYMASADLTDITQVNVYKNLIKDKGTLNALKAFKGANLPQGGIDYNIYENWAIKTGEYGGVLDNNFVELKLSEKSLTANPTIIGLTNGNNVEGAQQLVPIYSLFNYGRPIDSPNILPLTEDKPSTSFPDAGYVNLNDVKMSAYYYSNLPNAVDSTGRVVSINDMYVGDYIWLANYQASWQILTPSSAGQVLEVRANLNGTSVVRFKNDHNLNKYDIIAIINFDTLVNGYFVVTNIISSREILINLSLPPANRIVTGQGIALKFNSQRVAQPSDIQDLPLLNNEFVKNKAWVDVNNDGGWAVYQKSINYQYDRSFTNEGVSGRFGASVAYTQLSDYLFGDPDQGKVYRYQYDALSKEYVLDQILTGDISFGSVIVHEQNIYAISQPTNTPEVLVYTVNNTPVSDNIIPYQTITASTISPSITKFGDSVALSGDTNWMFVSDFNLTRNNVHVYRKRNELVDASAMISGKTYQITDVGTVNWTSLCADTIAKQSGIYFIYNGVAVTGTGTATRCDYEYITTLSSGSVVEDRFGYSISTDYYGTTVFIGAPNEDYTPSTPDIANWGRTYVYNRLVQNVLMDTEYDPANNPSYVLAWTPNLSQPITVTKNGFAVSTSDYTIVGNTITYNGVYTIGDILNISGNEFINTQVLETGQTPRIGVGFGTSVDNNTLGTEVIVGAPFALSSTNQEGAGFRFTNGGARFGTITGTSDVATTTTRQILLNGFLVNLPTGNATIVAKAIQDANIINVTAVANNGILTISCIDNELATMEQQLTLAVNDINTLSELGIDIYTQTQIIECPHIAGPTQFGTVVKFNEQNSVAISAPTGTRFAQTTFDFSDDENLDNDTVFDNNSTQFVDSYPNMGAVYTYDYLSNYNESLSNIGAYTYGQSANAKDQFSGASPGYGKAIDWHENKLVIGVPDYLPTSIDGQVIVYVNDSGIPNWHVYRHTSEIVNINNVQNLQLFSAETNNTLMNLDYFDPLQGKILGVVRQNIDVISNIDPANYNNATTQSGIVWGDAQVGSIWFDTSNVRYINYHQNDNTYNARRWGTLFPGSDVAVYSWVASPVVPASYQGPGIPRDIINYTVQTALNASNSITPVYYFWVRNSGIVFSERGKTLADLNLASYIANPQQSGISYLAPLASDTVALYNCKPYINANDTVLHIGFGDTTEENPSHQEFTLIRQDYADDFLPGLPGTGDYLVPESLYDRMLDSLSGVDEQGEVVPNPLLPKAVQTGVLARPRQSFFYNRYLALKNYIQYANEVMASKPIVEIREDAIKGFLQKSGEFYDTKMYWERVNWWDIGYDNNTKAALQVALYADLSTLDVPVGTIVTVTGSTNINLSGNSSTYVYTEGDVWKRIGLENGTIQFSSSLYDYAAAGYGFDGTFYDTDVYDLYPSEETRWIIRALNEQIYTDELLINRNKSLILLFEYIQEETVENQNFLPWLNKTSLIDVSHKIRELKTIQNYVSDNQEFLAGYVNETKPYHVLVKEFLFEYTGGDVYPGTLTDFDLPSQYNTTIDNFVSPQLVYDTATNEYQYGANAAIWNQQEYNEWFTNYGVSIGQYQNNNIIGQLNYPIATLKSYVTLLSDELIVDSVQGFPINGYIKLYDLNNPTAYEIIGYSYVNRATNVVGGLVRGQFGTQTANHIPGLTIYMDLPPVILLNGGKGYSNPPRVIATVPDGYPQPRVDAVLEAVMSGSTVTSINVINAGSGYPVTPDIRIDPSIQYSFSSTNVVTLNNTIEIYAPELQTGDLIRYVAGTKNVGGLTDDQWYYVNVLNSSPTTIMALYQTYADALQDNNRVRLLDQGTGTQTIQLGAKAFAITNSAPVRENNLTLRFDRTSYDTQVRDWQPNVFYGGEFVGYYTQASSSSLSLASVQPDIYNVLSSAEGTVFPLQNIDNLRQLTWSSGPEPDGRSVDDIANSQIGLSFTASIGDLYPSGSTIGFTVGMPVKFTGDVGSDIIENEIYYVAEVIDLKYFTIKDEDGIIVSLQNYTPANKMRVFTATITDTAVITTSYPGIRNLVATNSTNNVVTLDLTDIGTAGTEGLYTKLPVYFTGNTFGGIEENKIYYVVSVLSNQNFTMSEQNDPVMVQILQTNLASQIICEAFTGLSVNEPVVFDNMVINGDAVDSFGNIDKQKIYYIKSIDNNVITISETLGGSIFDTGVVEPNDNTFCFLTGQGSCVSLTTATGSATMSISMPLSPGQVNGQQFTFYPTSREFADITSSAYGNLVEKDILKTLAYNTHDSNAIISGNQLAISPNNSYLYNNIPFSVSEDIGGLLRLKPSTSERQIYYATDIQNISVGVKSTTVSSLVFNGSAADDELTVSTIVSGTGLLYPGTEIVGSNVEQNTYIIEQISGTTGGVGTYKISRTYFVPATLTGASASTGIIVLADDYFTDMIFENMPITFTGVNSFGGVLLNFRYYVRHILSGFGQKRFTVSVVPGQSAAVFTNATGSLTGTGPSAMQVYLPATELMTGDDYFIKTIGDTNFATIGATYLVNGSNVIAGNYYIINDVGAGSDTFWSTISGTTLEVEKDTIVYAKNSGVMDAFSGTAYRVDFQASGAGTGTGQAIVKLQDGDGPAVWQQRIVSPAQFDIGFVLGGYNVIVNNGGIGFTQNNTITISGDLLGGTTPENDLTIQVSRINSIVPGTYSWSLPKTSNGTITKVICTGTPIGNSTKYFLKVDTANTFKVYNDPLFTNPVSGINFPYQGYTVANITNVRYGLDVVLTDASGFNINDGIVFTDTQNLYVDAGQTYYIVSINYSTNTISIGTEPGNPAINVYDPGIDYAFATGDQPTVAKPGSFMLLPEPFYFNPSIVKYNNRVWECVVSNDDPTFVLGKWKLLGSGDPKLNALDRAKGYYAPTVNMPGYDLNQLFTGLTYPNTTYKGNEFEIDKQFALDTQLIDRPFDPSNLNMPAVAFDGTNYLAPANLPNYAGIVADLEVTDDWLLAKLSDQTLSLTDLIRADNKYLMTSTNSPTPIFKSDNYQIWSTAGFYIPVNTPVADIEFKKKRLIAAGLSLNAITYDDNKYIAVGKNILTSEDTINWFERLVLPAGSTFNDVSYVSASDFNGYIAVGQTDTGTGIIYTSEDGLNWTDATPNNNRIFNGVTSGYGQIFVVGNDKIILSSADAETWTQVAFESGKTLNDILFANELLVAVGNNGLVLVSNDGYTWNVKPTNTTENLNSLMYVDIKNEWTIVGNNNTIIQANNINANPVIWDTTQLFSTPDPENIVVGSPFQSGYGPEEMVPGIVYDQLTMIVNTRAGTNWPATTYQHVGYNVVSVEIDQNETNVYSFDGYTQTPALISVFKLVDGLSVSLYETNDYTVNYVNKTVTLVDPLTSGEQLRIDIYEVGNGDQLVKSNTQTDPIDRNVETGFDEIELNCNYAGVNYTGGGIVNPGSETIAVEATETYGIDDTILCSDVSQFTVNGEITFAGAVFGGVDLGVPYYVKSINTVRSVITISETLVNGIAGPTLNLSSMTGYMNVIIQKGPGSLFTEPGVFYNGKKLNVGYSNYIISSSSVNNAFVTFSTSNLVTGQKIKFSDTIFGGVLPQHTYYIKQILGPTQFTICDSLGNTIPLTSATGSAIFVTGDYAVAVSNNQISAKMILADRYDIDVDYISYSFFNQTDPQYGFTIPQTQVFNGEDITGPYLLTNYLGGFNTQNAIVEVNGYRVEPSKYIINFATQQIEFDDIINDDDVVAVTTFNDTQRQYLFTTQYASDKQVSPIASVNNLISPLQPTTRIFTTIEHGLVDNDVIRIDGCVGSTQLNNQLFTVQKLDDNTIRIYEYVHGVPYTSSASVTEVSNYISGGYIWKYETWMLEDMYATSCGTTTLSVAEVDGLVVDTPVYFTEDGVAIGYPLTSIPELIAGTEYYIKSINEFTNEFTISDSQGGATKTLTPNSGINVRITQWEQTNVDRLWVTVNGERVASSNLRLNAANELSILTEVIPGDVVIITNMMPSATPGNQTYLQIVDQDGVGAVYRANSETQTWLVKPVGEFDTTVYVDDVTKITNITQQTSTTPIATAGYHNIGLNANKNDILLVRVYNNNPARLGYIDQDYITTHVSGLGPFVEITEGEWIEAGDILTITVLLGNIIYVNGEYMQINAVDLSLNLVEVQRGAFGSPVLNYIPVNSIVYSLLDDNKMSQINYNDTWNKIPGVYNVTKGDPLQIAEGSGPSFLRVDIS